MKKLIIACLLLAAIFLVSAPAFAGNSCICIGIGSSGICGNGLAGTFPTKITPDDSNVNDYIKSALARNNLTSYGKAYDWNTGWFCWKGSL